MFRYDKIKLIYWSENAAHLQLDHIYKLLALVYNHT